MEWFYKINKKMKLHLDKIKGIALPLNLIQITLEGIDLLADENEISRLKEAIAELKKIVINMD